MGPMLPSVVALAAALVCVAAVPPASAQDADPGRSVVVAVLPYNVPVEQIGEVEAPFAGDHERRDRDAAPRLRASSTSARETG